MLLVNFIFGRGKVAGIGIERFEESVKRAVGDVTDAWWGNLIILDFLQDFRVDAHLLVGAVLFAAGVDAENAELAKNKAKAKCGKNDEREDEDETF